MLPPAFFVCFIIFRCAQNRANRLFVLSHLCIIEVMQHVIFYTKLNCSLCDEAHRMLMDLAFDLPMEIDILDISHRHHK